jgi:signal peptidase
MTSGTTWWKKFADVLLWVAAVGGLFSIGLVVVSLGFGISLIMFKTGSMSPTIPAGSLAVVKEIPASDIRVGDVMTLDRENQLPISHRVTSVSGDGDTFRSLTMRGDANNTDDPVVYVVDKGRIVLWSMPGLASVVVWFSNPIVLGALTLAMAFLVTWAFWPRTRKPDRTHPSERAQSAA